jgi:signal peptidase II
VTAPTSFRRYGLTAGVAVAVIVIDQLTKWWALETLTTRTIDLFWTLRFRLAFNTGAAFSMGSDSQFGRYIPFAALLVVALVVWQGRTIGSRLGSVALGLILGGAIGNLIDRLFRAGSGGFMSGAVVDFIDPQWFPIFNIADSGVVVGGFLLVLVSLRTPTADDDGEVGADEVERAREPDPLTDDIGRRDPGADDRAGSGQRPTDDEDRP